MKKLVIILGLIVGFGSLNAQAWEAKNLNIDLGYVVGSHSGDFYSPGVLFSVEKGIHKWIGVGVYSGYQYNITNFIGTSYTAKYHSVPVGGFGAFHFYQMISDLVGKEIGSDKLDVSIKHSFGTRFDIYNNLNIYFDWGTSLTARYMFKENIGVYAEVGYPAMGNLVVGGAFKF